MVEDVLTGQLFLLVFQYGVIMTNDIARTYLNLNMLGIACTYLNLNMSDITLSFRFTPPLDVHFKPSIINHRTTSRWHSYDSPTLVLSV